jgi:hypothetical protein
MAVLVLIILQVFKNIAILEFSLEAVKLRAIDFSKILIQDRYKK